MGKTLSGKEPAAAILDKAKERISKLGRAPGLAIVQVGEDPASTVYVNMKAKKADSMGLKADVHRLHETTKEPELLELVEKLNSDKTVDGFMVQLPLPKHIDPAKIIEAISPAKDVDGFTSRNMGSLFLNMDEKSILLPATPAGIIRMLEFYKVPIEGKHAVIVGRSNIVGRPIAVMLLNRNATVTICHSRTKGLAEHTKNADILVAAVGKPGLITAEMVKEEAYVIDVGTTRVEGKIVGDVDFENVIKKAHCSPVPGGVGPMTVAMLISNVVEAASR
jgi:methylenetetrahydrofolate dehydrogenase (NADP+)/methenyltetrahydrofolate cyclohydrolase